MLGFAFNISRLRPAFCTVSYLGALVVSLFPAGPIRGQSSPELSLDPDKSFTQYVQDSWQMDDGLPQNTVRAIAQTPDGYLWLGTQEGLVRFDGNRFVVFDRSRIPALQSNDIVALYAARDGSLWIGTHGGGLSRYRGGRFTTYDQKNGLPGNDVYAIVEDRSGTIWIGTIGGGLGRWANGRISRIGKQDGLAGDAVLSLAVDGRGRIWVGADGGLSLVDGRNVRTFTTAQGLPGNLVRSVWIDSADRIWVGTSSGLGLMENGRIIRISSLAQVDVSDIRRDAGGTLWVGTLAGGLCRMTTDDTDCYTVDQGLTHNSVRSVFEDREGNLWIGTDGGGLNRLRDGKFTVYTTTEGLADDVVYSVYEDYAGTMWIGTETGRVSLLNGGRFGTPAGQAAFSGYSIMSFEQSDDEDVWVGTDGGGLFRLHRGRVQRFTTADGLPGNTVRAIYRDRNNVLWIGTDDGLAQVRDGRIQAPERSAGLSQAGVLSITEDHEGSLWFGTFDGLVRLKIGKYTTYNRSNGFEGEIVLALHADVDGTLWVGTYGGGLIRYKEGRFFAVNTRNGLPSDNVMQILGDENGGLWLGSNKGIIRLEKARLDAFIAGKSPQFYPVVYGKSDGLKTAECNGGMQPAAWRSRDGRLWFSTMKGVAFIDPAHIRKNTVPPSVVVERFVSDKKEYRLGSPIELPAGSHDFEIYYTGISLSDPGTVRFRYKLDGRDTEWSEITDRRSVFYSNLDPGTYTLHIAAANGDGVWNATGVSVTFHVASYFYQTYWFMALSVITVILLGMGAYQARVRQLRSRQRELEALVEERTRDLYEEKERVEQSKAVIEEQAKKLIELDEVKTRFFSNMSHEFRTPLTLTIGPLENALSGSYGPVNGDLKNQLGLMLRNARRLLRLINQLLDIARLESGIVRLQAGPSDLVAFLKRLVLPFSTFADQKTIDFQFRSPLPSLEVYFEPDKLEKVFYNLLSNAFKFTPEKGSVWVEVRKEERHELRGKTDYAVVRVGDTGKGIPGDDLGRVFDRFQQAAGSASKEQEGSGIGLALARELVELHGGTIQVESQVGKGSVFTVRIPLGREHLTDDQIVDVPDRTRTQPDDQRIKNELAVLGEEPALEETPAVQDVLLPLVLVVDDNTDVCTYIRQCLKSQYRVILAHDGVDALEKAAADTPDLIVSDLMMPRMDGYELSRQVRSNEALKHIPILLLTAKASEETKLEGLELGIDDYMTKPFNGRELLARVGNLIKMRAQERELKVLNEALEERVRQQLDTILRSKRLTKYFSKNLLDQILSSEKEVTLTSERRLVTVFFSDLTGFTELSETVDPEKVTWLLNHYLTEMVPLIERFQGTLDKFMGDGIMAFFGAPGEMDATAQARQAVAMAVAMQDRITQLADVWSAAGIQNRIQVRMGIHQSYVTVGNFGSRELLEYTVIGRGVNLAKRLESSCTPGQVLVSAQVYSLLDPAYQCGTYDARSFKGIAQPIDVWQIDPARIAQVVGTE